MHGVSGEEILQGLFPVQQMGEESASTALTCTMCSWMTWRWRRSDILGGEKGGFDLLLGTTAIGKLAFAAVFAGAAEGGLRPVQGLHPQQDAQGHLHCQIPDGAAAHVGHCGQHAVHEADALPRSPGRGDVRRKYAPGAGGPPPWRRAISQTCPTRQSRCASTPSAPTAGWRSTMWSGISGILLFSRILREMRMYRG